MRWFQRRCPCEHADTVSATTEVMDRLGWQVLLRVSWCPCCGKTEIEEVERRRA